jgi:cell division protease FtsH
MHTREYSDETARVIDEEVERILREGEDRCREVLGANRHGLDLVARALLEHETIDGAEVTRLINLAGGTGTGTPGASSTGPAPAEAGDAPAPASAPYVGGNGGDTSWTAPSYPPPVPPT